MANQDLADILEAATALLKHASHPLRSSSTRGTKQENQMRASFRRFDRARMWEEQMEAGAGAKAFKR